LSDFDADFVPTMEKLLADDAADHIHWMVPDVAVSSFSPSRCKKARAFAILFRSSLEVRMQVKRLMANHVRLWFDHESH
jgi:hypothetical protein